MPTSWILLPLYKVSKNVLALSNLVGKFISLLLFWEPFGVAVGWGVDCGTGIVLGVGSLLVEAVSSVVSVLSLLDTTTSLLVFPSIDIVFFKYSIFWDLSLKYRSWLKVKFGV